MFGKHLGILHKKKLFRAPRDRTSAQGARIQLDGNFYVNFASNDYLGLASHPYIIKAVNISLNKYGFGSGASRILGGGSKLHRDLEEKIAQFKGTGSALVFNSGFAANTGVIPALTDENTAIFSDELNHASIIDGCRLSRAKTLIYRHKDISHLRNLIRRNRAGKKVVITDSIFSMDGDIAPLSDIAAVCREGGAVLYVDEAHSTGVLGKGKGALAHFNLPSEEWIIQMGTFSKALGSFGAFIASAPDVVQWITNTARSFIYSTALPACVVAGSLAALELVENNPGLIAKLWDNREKAAKYIQTMGYSIMESETPILPMKTGTVKNTLRLSAYLLKKGIFAPAIRPPTVKEPRIRITITATHTEEDINRLMKALKKA
jgi:8-amino-7-oxononanoate synthase